MDNLRRLDPEWYTKGMIGETVLMNLEHYVYNKDEPNWTGFTMWAFNFGLNKSEVISIIKEAMVTETLDNNAQL
jgi:hypothetical protein